MSIETGIESVLAGLAIEIAKLVVVKYMDNKSIKELSEEEHDEPPWYKKAKVLKWKMT